MQLVTGDYMPGLNCVCRSGNRCTAHRAYIASKRVQRRLAGLCYRCGSAKRADRALCDYHLELARETQREVLRKRRKRAGIILAVCVRCHSRAKEHRCPE